MTDNGMPRFLHVANGTSTTRTIELAGIPGARSIWADPLYEGPVPGGLNDAELVDVRIQYLAGAQDVTWAAWAGGDPSLDPANDFRQWRATIEQRESYDELILWFEHDLFDQLNLIQLVTWIRDRLPSRTPVSLICIGAFPGRPDFKGLGQLTPAELASLFDTRQPVTDSQYDVARRAWHAFRQPTPKALQDLLDDNMSTLPYLAPAITRFLQEFPWTTDGLSLTERHLLRLASGGRIALRDAFPRMQEGEPAYSVTDSTLAAVAETLSRTSPPLVALDLADGSDGRSLRGSVLLTETGRSVLAGQQDRVAICGLDRWLGGVHLQTGGEIWRWDDAQRRVTVRRT